MNEPADEKLVAAEAMNPLTPGATVVSSTVISSTPAGTSSSWSAFSALVNPQWLKNTLKLCLAFAPACIFPAVLITGAGLAMSFGLYGCISQLKQHVLQLQNILAAAGIMFGMMFICILGFIWGFTVWLVRLNTFGHAFCMVDVVNGRILSPITNDSEATATAALAGTEAAAATADGELTSNALRALFKSSHAFVLSRKKYLARFYFLVSMVALLPCMVWMALCTVKMFSLQSPSPLIMKLSLPPMADICLTGGVAILGAYLVGLSWISVVVSSISKEGANAASWECVKLSVAHVVPMTLLAILVAVLNVVVATPQVIINPASLLSSELLSDNLPASIASQVWQGLTSIVLLTFSLSPFCELLRDRVK